MKQYNNPEKKLWKEITARPAMPMQQMFDQVRPILNEVKNAGDEALFSFTKKFDDVLLSSLIVSDAEIQDATHQLPDALKNAINQAAKNLQLFHAAQQNAVEKIETMPGVLCWRKSVGIDKVGLYIPGGTAPLFSTVLMLALPAKLAGCKQIIMCTPVQKDGSMHPAILYAASIAGVSTIVKIGGAQAIAAMAYGTESVPAVYKIFGPGNQYVTAAKQLVQLDGIAIDMPAGPSEVCVLGDGTANAKYIAADLLSQAEHGADSQVLLVSTSEQLITDVRVALNHQLLSLPRVEFINKSLLNSRAVYFENMADAIELVNDYAAEHLIINAQNANALADGITNAGSIFIGGYSPESVGDYASGTNHTLPTNGFARMYSGISVDSFVKKITLQQLSPSGLKAIAPTVIAMAEAEGLQAHANAVKIRLEE